MALSGITVERTSKGLPKSITFDYKIYGGLLQNFFIKEGLEHLYSPYNKEEAEKLLSIKSDMKLGARRKVDMSNFWNE